MYFVGIVSVFFFVVVALQVSVFMYSSDYPKHNIVQSMTLRSYRVSTYHRYICRRILVEYYIYILYVLFGSLGFVSKH